MFSVPYILLGSMVLVPLILSGEFSSVDEVVDAQVARPTLYGLAYSNYTYAYKVKAVLRRSPEIVSLGSSRVMQFRDFFFTKKKGAFYNAGGGAETIGDFLDFINEIPESQYPKILIVGLDQCFFNLNWDPMKVERNIVKENLQKEPTTVLKHSRSFMVDVIKGKVKWRDMIRIKDPLWGKYNTVGVYAKVRGSGHRNDGSYVYGEVLSDPEMKVIKENFPDTFDRIRSASRRFEHGNTVSQPALNELKRFLKFCKDHDIYVVGFLAPFAPVVYDAIYGNSGYMYLSQLAGEIEPIFKEHAFSFFDFSDVRSLGATNAEFVDGFHGSSVTYMRMLIKMAQEDETLRLYTDPQALEEIFNSLEQPVVVYSLDQRYIF